MGRHRNYGGSGTVTPEPIDAMLQVTVTLSAAQVKAIHTTPQIIVPAPGPGFMLLPMAIIGQVRPGGTAFAAGADMGLWYGPAAGGAFWGRTLFATDVHSMTANIREFAPVDSTGLQSVLSDFENRALEVSAASDFTLGDGELTFTIDYVLIPVF